jgi:hypothetical protein
VASFLARARAFPPHYPCIDCSSLLLALVMLKHYKIIQLMIFTLLLSLLLQLLLLFAPRCSSLIVHTCWLHYQPRVRGLASRLQRIVACVTADCRRSYQTEMQI